MDTEAEAIFEESGALRRSLFDARAIAALERTRAWLEERGRRMFLPLDLMIILLERGDRALASAISASVEADASAEELLDRLRAIANEIEEDALGERPELARTFFSRGFTRILGEALWQARAGRARGPVTEDHLGRSLIWRAESAESASVRWAIRRLGERASDSIFDERGMLRRSAFTPPTWQVLIAASRLAASRGTPFLGTPHMIASLCMVRHSALWRSAKARGFDPVRLRDELMRLIGAKSDSIPVFALGRKTLTPRMIRMLSVEGEELVDEASIVGHFLADGGSSLELIQALGLESELRRALGDPKVFEQAPAQEAQRGHGPESTRVPTPTLDMLGRDLTEDAIEGKLPSIVGRERELERVINVLLRREQRNPLLTGEAGVGKTALAIGLAMRIARGAVPKRLKNHRVVEINGANLVSGTSYRGDLETRIKGLLEEAAGQVILFIDEAHAVFAPRAGSQAPAEVPNHFKSALASGAIAVVAATTEAEYRRWIEQDPALRRRFERVEIAEPPRPLVEHILTSLVPELEREYEVSVGPGVIDDAIEMSVRYLPEQRLPDKAKKLLMDACIARATRDGADGDQASSEQGRARLVDRAEIARQIHAKTGVPIERLTRGAARWWVGIADRLNERVDGQRAAVEAVARALVSARMRAGHDARPLASFLFYGPAGVGKATLAASLAEEVFGSRRALVRLDMTDFQEPHAISRLVGSPPGYVGYEDEDLLVTPIRRRPSSLVLLEDFDRAHPHVQERLLRLLREGEIADTRGYRADVRNAIFVLTVTSFAERASIGFGAEELGGAPGASAEIERFARRVDAAVALAQTLWDDDASLSALVDRHARRFERVVREEYRAEVLVSACARRELGLRLRAARTDAERRAALDAVLYDPMTAALLSGEVPAAGHLKWEGDGARIEERRGSQAQPI